MEDKGEKDMLAHISEDGRTQTIEEHLQGTAGQAGSFAAEFGCEEFGRLCGLLHDIGKYSAEFQERLRNPLPSNRVDHSTAGAMEAEKINKNFIPIGMVIAGHHSGLMDGGNAKVSRAGDGTYFGRRKSKIPDYGEWEHEKRNILADGHEKDIVFPPFCQENKFAMSFFIRILYSCLVDADYLDTESFMLQNPAPRGKYDTMETLLRRFEAYVGRWFQNERPNCAGTLARPDKNAMLCRCRNKILRECMEKGEAYPRGIYTLTVPTGGGKTTASTGFALKHVCAHAMKRIIYVIPYTSVIEQNAAVFERIFGQENVVEHHSGIVYDTDKTDDEMGEGEERMLGYRRALATENWDAPIIVTTAVQFFESLYAAKSSKCRKLHNLANSVIIFDEAQTLPVPYLEPCVAAMAQLVKNYGATIVLCTATQPALAKMFEKYLPGKALQEICSGTENMVREFARVDIINLEQISEEDLKARLKAETQVLCIVNRRRLAQKLYESLEGDGGYCLTTLLYPAARKQKFEEIKARLSEGKPCRVIATSLIEAGVDLDFPCVYRQEAGLDSLIQAAGRCNRENRRLASESKVYSFRLEGEPDRLFAQTTAALRETWRRYGQVDASEAIAFYFTFYRNLLGQENLDRKEIVSAWEKGINGNCFPFAAIDKKFRLIDSATRTVFIPVQESQELLEKAALHQADKNTFRRLGKYGVNVYEEHFEKLREAGCLEEIDREVFVLRDQNQYKEDTGLQMDVDTGYGIMI